MTVNTHVGFEIRVLSNLIYRRINQMSAQEGETLTANQDWVLHFFDSAQGRDIMQRDIEKEFFNPPFYGQPDSAADGAQRIYPPGAGFL